MNIGQASAASGVSAKMIRYYEETGLIPAIRRSDAGYRVYGERDIQMLRFVRRARDLGFPVEQIGELLALWRDTSRHSADVKLLANQRIDELHRKIDAMQEMVSTLQTLADSCHGDARPDCPILADLSRDEPPARTGRRTGLRQGQ
jgi:MerR family gold-responsive transcriptional activator of gol and ges genes